MKRISLASQSDEFGYRVYTSSDIVQNKNDFVADVDDAISRMKLKFGDVDSTKFYSFYNTFNLTAGSMRFHNLLSDLKTVIREYHGNDEPLWMQCWINYHTPSGVLKRHDHINCVCHGYISINPHKTTTVFDDYNIVNEVGNIYIGKSNLMHWVDVVETFDEPRITLGYDVFSEREIINLKRQYGIDINISMMPI